MIVVKTKEEVSDCLKNLKANSSVGFVPTMGALHDGHISLVLEAKRQTDFVVTSIFVNPTQFDSKDDLDKYPNLLNEDLALLEASGCNLVFTPEVDAIYADYEGVNLSLHPLDTYMEGQFRKGHFKGVVDIVFRFFDIIEPNKAFFGLKDFQQVSIVKFMTEKMNLDIEIIACPTIRESNGLAKSSRNLRLNSSEKEKSGVIFRAMKLAQEWCLIYSVDETRKKCEDLINSSGLKVEYVSIVHPVSLVEMANWEPGAHICVVAFCGEVRLIDNMQLIEF